MSSQSSSFSLPRDARRDVGAASPQQQHRRSHGQQQQQKQRGDSHMSIPPLMRNGSSHSSNPSSGSGLPLYTDVVIVGAGPAGLTLALSLALQGVSFVIVDAAPCTPQESRSLTVHARTLEILEDLGVAGSFLTLGLLCRAFELWVSGRKSLSVPLRDTETAAAPVRVPTLKALASLAGSLTASSDAPEVNAACSSGSPFPFALILPQATTCQILERRLNQLGHEVHRPVAVWQIQGFDADEPSAFPVDQRTQQQQQQQQQKQRQQRSTESTLTTQEDSDQSSFRSPHEVADEPQVIAGAEQRQVHRQEQQPQQEQQQQEESFFPAFTAGGHASRRDSSNSQLGYPVSVHFGHYVPRNGSSSFSATTPASVDEPPVRFGVVCCRYVVGCDGPRSAVRKAGGISFEQRTNPRSFIVADLQLSPTLMSACSSTVSPAQSPVLGASSSPTRTPPESPRGEFNGNPTQAFAASPFQLANRHQQGEDDVPLTLSSWEQQQQQQEASSCQLLGCGGLGVPVDGLWGEGLLSGLGKRLHAAAAAALEPGEAERARLMASGRRTAAGDAVEIHLTSKGFAACIPMLKTASASAVAQATDFGSRKSGSYGGSRSFRQQQLLMHRRSTRPADTSAFRWRVVTEKIPSMTALAPSHAMSFTDSAVAPAAAAAATAAAVAGENDTRRQESQAETREELLQQVERIFVGCRVTEVYWSAVYKSAVRMASVLRRKRLLLAGDAAHVHPSILGQGMNLGMQNAYNLGWKLARVLRHGASPQLLDSYSEEAKQAAEQVVGLSDRFFQSVLSANGSGGLLSRLLLRMGAAVASHLPSAARSFGQTLIALGNGDSSFISGLKPGCRAPDCLVKVARFPKMHPPDVADPVAGYLFELLGKGRHLLLLHIMLLPPGARKQNIFGCEIAGAPLVSRYNNEAVSTLARLCQLAVLAAAKGASSAAPSPVCKDLNSSRSGSFNVSAAAAQSLHAPFSAADFVDFPAGLETGLGSSSWRRGAGSSDSETDDDNAYEDGFYGADSGRDTSMGTANSRPLSSRRGLETPMAAAAAAEASAEGGAPVGGRVLRRHTECPTASGASAAATERQLWASDLRVVWCFHGPTAAVHTTATSTSITSEIVRGNSRCIPPAKSRSLLQQQQQQARLPSGSPVAAAAASNAKIEVEECHLVERPLLQLLPPALLQQMQQASSGSKGSGGFILIDFLSDLQSKFGLSLADPHASDGAEASCGFCLIRPDGYLAHCGKVGDTKAARGLLDYLIRF
ncbi:FAD-depdendent monooxygenase, putative [Eimeria necatrix]|uniref:FAD-depdendent monooxygenase, putative n=1 Tax=Eimeria necatrix TaxID=51315 RepID=U6MUZ8_9EIME|nr:FAD-depdendent monooxygenase, putative [Eimeria necatrix]CDJ65510.1 FAD-depdendent monooxygenase, putative [Eimeria necatrix]